MYRSLLINNAGQIRYFIQITHQFLLDDSCYFEAAKITALLSLLDIYIIQRRKILVFSQVRSLDSATPRTINPSVIVYHDVGYSSNRPAEKTHQFLGYDRIHSYRCLTVIGGYVCRGFKYAISCFSSLH